MSGHVEFAKVKQRDVYGWYRSFARTVFKLFTECSERCVHALNRSNFEGCGKVVDGLAAHPRVVERVVCNCLALYFWLLFLIVHGRMVRAVSKIIDARLLWDLYFWRK